MKKRILALAMTIAMVFSSMAVLSTVSFAADDHDDCVHFDETLATVDAYHATVAVDGATDAYVMVQEYLANGTRYGVAWDYDYIYVIFAAATKKLSAVEFTVGATEVKVDVATATVTGVEGAKAAGNADYLEVAIPLKAVTLHFTQTTAYAPLAAEVVSNATSGATSKINVNVEITGKTMILGYERYVGNKIAGRSLGLWSSADIVTNVVNSDSSFTFAQVATLNNNGRGQATFQFLRDLMTPFTSGVEVSGEWDLTINDLPASSAPATVPHGYQSNVTSGMVLALGTKNEPAKNSEASAFGAFVYNDTTTGLSVLIPTKYDRTAYQKYDLGVDLGDTFRLRLDVAVDHTVTVSVDGTVLGSVQVVPYKDMIAGGRGCVETSLVTKNMQGSNVTVNNLSVCLNPEVDLAKLKTVAKNAYGTTAEKLIVAENTPLVGTVYAKYGDAANLGSFSKVEAYWSADKKAITLRIPVSALMTTEIINGDNTATVALTVEDEVYKAAVTGVPGASVALAYNFASVTLPLHQVTVRTDAGKIFADFVIKTNNGAVAIEEKVTVLFSFTGADSVVSTKWDRKELVVERYDGSYGFTVVSGANTNNAVYRVSGVSAISQMYTGRVNTKQTAFGFYLNGVTGTRYTSYELKVEALAAVELTAATYSAQADGHEHIAVIIRAARDASAEAKTVGYDYTIRNVIPSSGVAADATICLIFRGDVVVDTGKKLNESFNLRVEWDTNGTAKVFVDGVEKGTAANAVINVDAYLHPTGKSGFSFRSHNGSIATWEYTNFETGFVGEAVDMSVAEFMALTKNTATDVPAYEDVEEAIELNAVQNFGKASDTDYSQRFVATIDTLDYKYAGFQLANAAGEKATLRVFTGNTSILEGEEEVEAPEGKYFVTYTFDKDSALVNQTFFVRAFVVDADRKFTYGDTYKVTVNAEGQMTSAELVLNPTIFG